LQTLYAILQSVYGEEYFSKRGTLTASSATTNLPSDFLKVLRLFYIRGTDDIVEINRGGIDDLVTAERSSQAWSSVTPKYKLEGATIRWLPTPSASCSVAIHYVYAPADLSGGSDTFDAGPGWEDFVVADVCRRIAEREDKDPSEWLAMRQIAEDRIKAQAPRHETEALQLRDEYYGDMARQGDRQYRDWLTWGRFNP
jgi:hypothetical protein